MSLSFNGRFSLNFSPLKMSFDVLIVFVSFFYARCRFAYILIYCMKGEISL